MNRLKRLGVIAFAGYSISATSFGTTAIWDGGAGVAGYGSISNATNWNPNALPGNTDDLQFGVETGGTGDIYFDNGVTMANSMTFVSGAPKYTVAAAGSGDYLQLNGANASGFALQNSSSVQQVFAGLTINVGSAAQTWDAGTAGLLFSSIDLGFDTALTISSAGTTASTLSTISGKITGTGTAGSLTKTGVGILSLNSPSSFPNDYTGTTKVSAGTLRLDSANQIPNASRLDLNGGTLNSNGFADTIGKLSLTANSTIDLGSGTSVLTFAASNDQDWSTFKLTISNYTAGVDELQFLNSGASSGLTTAQLSGFRFNGTTAAQIDAQGVVTPIPEPSSLALLGLSAMGAGWAHLRRRRN